MSGPKRFWQKGVQSIVTDFQRFFLARTLLEDKLYPPLAMDVKFRPYEANDFGSCAAIYAKNESGRFPVDDRVKFEEFLKKERKTLIVAEYNSRVVGCGGMNVVAANAVILCYGLIDPDFQRQRIGSTLTLLRIAQMEPQPDGIFALIFAVEPSMEVYRRFGFVQISRWKAGDGTEYPVGLLHISLKSLKRVKSVLKRRGLQVHGNLVVHPSDELSFDVKRVEGRCRIELEPRNENGDPPRLS